MKARILVVTVVGSLVLVASPAYAGVRGTQPSRQLQSVVIGDGGSVAPIRRAPTAFAYHLAKPPWKAPNHDQVTRDAI